MKTFQEFYKNNNPLVVELGCGKGEYAVGQAQRNLDKNYLLVLEGNYSGSDHVSGNGKSEEIFL